MTKFYLGLFALMTTCTLSAQTVFGTVSAADGSTLPGAYLYWSAGDRHAHTDELGRFRMTGPAAGDTLHVSYLGFAGLDVVLQAADSARSIPIRLDASDLDLRAVTISSSEQPQRIVSDLDVAVRSVTNSQELLQTVPGLFIGQHAGGGKAEQLFLRGFDIDHGTDVAISVDGMPVNMVSHAHGQGYADLHFLLPETIEAIDYDKGPYEASQGNFATAGAVNFRTKDRLESSSIKVEAGSFNTQRTVAQVSILNKKRHAAYLTGAYLTADGPFESPQNFSRGNLFARYTGQLRNNDKLTVSLSHFSSTWDASGQIPQRAVDRGLIGRFGAIDDTEGGTTGRSDLIVNYVRELDAATYLKSTVSATRYDFELFSNFTFFLEDPEFGDQIRQQEQRTMWTAQSVLHHETALGGTAAHLRLGIGQRSDRTEGSSLANTINRTTVQDFVQLGDVAEDNQFVFADATLEFGRLSVQPAVRLDRFRFGYRNDLTAEYSNLTETKTTLNPKLKINYQAGEAARVYLNAGTGFHANDSRLVTAGTTQGYTPRAFGADLGVETKLAPRLLVNAAAWYLALEQEFVYVGDAGIVELSGPTRRLGADLSARYQVTDWLFADADATYSHARSVAAEAGADRIPLAPVLTLAGGLHARHDGWVGGLRFRHLGDRPATEDYRLTAGGYFLLDANASYELGRATLGLRLQNLTNTRWNEAQFATESRLANETLATEEIHFTPGAPRSVNVLLTFRF